MSAFDNDEIEIVLRRASPRPVPSVEDEALVRDAVREEWLRTVKARRRRIRTWQLAAAAAFLALGVALVQVVRTPVVNVVEVAAITRSIGPVYLLAERAELRATGDLATVLSGQTIVTGDRAGLALDWGRGGSIRIDANSRVQFTDAGSVFLSDGRLYFDSTPAIPGEPAPAAVDFVLQTEAGEIRHIGTRYMGEVDSGTLIVTVRDGRVDVAGRYHQRTISGGQQVRFAGRQSPSTVDVSVSGHLWDWVARTTPPVEVAGRSVYDVLVWVTRELGLDLRFEGKARAVAAAAVLQGTIDRHPAEALQFALDVAALESRTEGDVIYIRTRN